MLKAAIVSTLLLFCVTTAVAHGPIHEKIEAVSKSIEADPGNPELYAQRSIYYRIDSDFAKARTDINTAKKLKPDYVEMDRLLAVLHLELGSLDSAEGFIDSYIVRRPKEAAGYFTKAMIAAAKEEYATAATDFEIALGLNPTPEPFHFIDLSRIMLKADSSSARALQVLRQAEEVLGFNIAIVEQQVNLLVASKAYENAVSKIIEVQQKLPNSMLWAFRKGEVEELISTERALVTYTAVLGQIEQLPIAKRGVPAISQLETQVRMRLQELSAAVPK